MSRQRRFPVGDEMLTIREIAERAGLTWTGARLRIERGISGLDLLKPGPGKPIEIDGELLTREEIAARAGVKPNAITQRLMRGEAGQDLLRPAAIAGGARFPVGDEMLTVREIAVRAGVTHQCVRYRLSIGMTGTALTARSDAASGLRFIRARRGPPATDERLWTAEIEALAKVVAATWRTGSDDLHKGWLRWTLTRHSSEIARLFRKGGRIYRFGRALMAQGITQDNGRALTETTVHNTWVRIEAALMQRMRERSNAA